jgi:hypothetical protein
MALGASGPKRSALPSGMAGLRQSASYGLLAAFAVVAASGCGAVAWQPVPQNMSGLVSARVSLLAPADTALEGLVAAYGDLAESENAPPKVGLAVGISSIVVGDKLASETGGDPIAWSDAFGDASGLDVQLTLKSPPRSIESLEAGDTFLLLRVTRDSYAGRDTGVNSYSDMTVTGGWVDGKTVFNPVDKKTGKIRPYLQYGGGLSHISAVEVNGGAGWVSTLALGFHMSLGVEMRIWKVVGVYLEAGVQTVKAPNLDALADAELKAQDLLEFPLRAGLLFSF